MTTPTNFMIGPVKDGLRKDVKPYAIPEDAFEVLNNAYQWRGRVLKRPGYTLLGTLANGTPVMGLRNRELFSIGQQQLIAFDTTNAYSYNGTTFVALSSVMPTVWSGTDYQFFWTTNYAGAFWATNSKLGLHGVNISTIDNANPAEVTTTVAHGFTTGQYVTIINVTGYLPLATTTPFLNGQVFQIVVTGATTYQLVGLNGALYGLYSSGGIGLNSQVSITGQDGIRYYANMSNNDTPVVGVGNTWANYNPPVDPNNVLMGALLIFPYRGYLVFLNTTEGNEQGFFKYPNRARWTQIGTPYYSNPVPNTPSLQGVDAKAVRDDLFGLGAANDAPTNETIVAAGFIRDVLIVYFERSTWRLRFVNNAQNPFVWERVNVEYGSQCTFSAITFDKGLMAIGNRGIVISDGNDTTRFDEKIPDDIFDIRASKFGFQRVYGIRTFRTRLCYWTYPSDLDSTGTFPNKLLIFNYDTKNWSYFDDSFTCFGYFYPAGVAQTWADMTEPWQSYELTWDSGIDSEGEENIIAGNQQGYVFLLEQTNGKNDPSLSISALVGGVVTSGNNNLDNGTWIKLKGVTGTTSTDGVSLNDRNFKVANVTADRNDFTLTEFEPIVAPTATGLIYSYPIGFTPISPGSVRVYINADLYTDNAQGIMTGPNGSGVINYDTGDLSFTFLAPYAAATVNIYVASYDQEQNIVPVGTTGAYIVGGTITKISNFDIQTKIFNFFGDDKRSRLSKIDFYVNETTNGQFTCNVLSDSSEEIVNQPLPDNPQSNVVLTSPNPYQFGSGDETIYRLFCDAVAQTIQLQLKMSDPQMASDAINTSNFELLAMMVTMRRAGRLP